MSITKTDSEDPVFIRDRLTYHVTIENHGDQPCERVRVRDSLPGGLTDIDIRTFGVSCTTRVRLIICNFGTMQPGDVDSVIISVDAPQNPGTITNRASVSALGDVRRDNDVASETTNIEPEDRDVVFIQGIYSRSTCVDADNNELADGFVERIDWVKNYLETQEWINSRVNLGNFLYSSYNTFCLFGDDLQIIPLYGAADTCDGVQQAALELRRLIDGLAEAKVTIIGHSMGGLVAAYMVATEPEDWVTSHIASVVTFDSPLQGIPLRNQLVLAASSSACSLQDESLVDLLEGSDVVKDASGAALLIPFYTIDAILSDALGIEFVPGDTTHIAGEKMHIRSRDQHGSVWFDSTQRKQRFVGCGVLSVESITDCRRVAR